MWEVRTILANELEHLAVLSPLAITTGPPQQEEGADRLTSILVHRERCTMRVNSLWAFILCPKEVTEARMHHPAALLCHCPVGRH